MAKIIEVKNVSFSYDKTESKQKKLAVDNCSFSVEKGEFVGIIGHNGSGKSTIAKLLNGIYAPMNGDILILGMNTKDEDKIWDIRQLAGIVFQNPDNQAVATIVEEDVAFGPENLSVPNNEIRQRIDKALETVRMTEFKDKQIHQLSGGQKQRIAIAGVLAMQPKIIILDEPTAMLDPLGRKEVIETISELNKKNNTTIVLITHYMEEIVNCDKIYVMDKGKVVMEGGPREIFSKVEELEKIDLDVPFASRISYELKNDGINISQAISIDELVEELCQLK